MLEGKKTYLGGIAAVLTGIGGILWSAYEGNPIDWNLGMGWVVTGITIIGGRSAYSNK